MTEFTKILLQNNPHILYKYYKDNRINYEELNHYEQHFLISAVFALCKFYKVWPIATEKQIINHLKHITNEQYNLF